MTYVFPPPMPGYTLILIARSLLVVWSLVGLVILIRRVQNWDHIRPFELKLWLVAAGISGVVACLGHCPFLEWDANQWLVPAVTAALSVSAAGFAIGLAKHSAEDFRLIVTTLAILGSVVSGIFLLQPDVRRRNSLKLHCMNNIRNDGIALITSSQLSNSFLPSAIGDGPISWRVGILPLLDLSSLLRQYDAHSSWDSVPNKQFASHRPPTYLCPDNYYPKDEQGRFFTSYSMPTGPGTIAGSPQGTKLSDITDGQSDTLLLVEASGSQIVWTEPRDVDVAAQASGISLNGDQPRQSASWISAYHNRGANVMMADGSVRFLSKTIDPSVLKKMATISGGEQIKPDELDGR